jgi:spermidine synthase
MKIRFKIKVLLVYLFISIFFIQPIFANSEKGSFWDTALYYLYKPVAFFLPHYEMMEKLYETETQYFNIFIGKDEAGKRHLIFLPMKGSQSIYDPSNPEKVFSKYIDYCLLSFPALGRQPENVLFLGLGGGIIPMAVRRAYSNVEIDIVEIDPQIPKIAKDYFGFKLDAKMHVKIEDGRVFVNACKKKYDIVFIDVYNADNIPFQFTTVEFYGNIKKMLSDDGVCVVNIANMGKEKFIESELCTIMNVFPNTYIFRCPGNTNYVPVIFKNKNISFTEFKNNIKKYDLSNKYFINFASLINDSLTENEVVKVKKKVPIILTDDYAPIYRLN